MRTSVRRASALNAGTRQWARGFSHPGEPLDVGTLETIAVEHTRETVRRFLAMHETSLARNAPGLLPCIAEWAEGDPAFDTVWDIAFGSCANAVFASSKVDPTSIAAAMGVRIALHGQAGQWEARLPRRTRLLAGRCVLPPGDTIEVTRGSGGRTTIRVTARGEAARNFVFGRELPESSAAFVDVHASAGSGRHRISLLGRSALESPAFDDERDRSFTTVGAELARDLRAALDVLRRHAPPYLPWVQRVLRQILPVQRANPELLESGSSNRRPGLVMMTFPVTRAPCAELLVHEATHQYLYLLERAGRMEDESDTTLYYSPIKGCDRPIGAILLAFHAFANVLLFYRMCQQSGLEDGGYCERQEKVLLPQLHDLLVPLRKTTGLTPHGRALWQPLADAIGA